jgi:hypothetical protein
MGKVDVQQLVSPFYVMPNVVMNTLRHAMFWHIHCLCNYFSCAIKFQLEKGIYHFWGDQVVGT